jgi:cysteinyl-tRNA synthetase
VGNRRLYTDAFVADMKVLNIEDPAVLCRATDHIPEQIEFIADIEKNGYAYRTSDGIYFDTVEATGLRLPRAPRRQGPGSRQARGPRGKEASVRLRAVEILGRGRKAADGMGQPVGPRLPGVAHRVLGDGAEVSRRLLRHPLRRRRPYPVHHTNEIAQTEARVGTRLANFWLHGYFLLSNDAKMAKSAGEFLRVQYLVDQGYDPLAFRYLCLTGHYRGQLNFTWDALDAAAVALDRMRNGVFALRDAGRGDAGCGADRTLR